MPDAGLPDKIIEAFTQDAGCWFTGRSLCLYKINIHVPLPRMPDAGSPDKFIGIFLWLLLRTPDAGSPDKIIVSGIVLWFLLGMPDAGSPADPIFFTESIFMFLYLGHQMPFCRIKLLEYC